MVQALQIPLRMRIDNAANIYPAALTKKSASLFRMSVTLTEPVDVSLLQEALETVSERIPTFRCRLQSGSFWWHLKRQKKAPQVRPLAPLNRPHFRDNGGFLYRVSPDGCRIVLDVFHALTDGTGAETFLLTLTGEYLRLRYGIDIVYGGKVLDPRDRPAADELGDAFKKVFSGRRGELEKSDDAYHIKGKKLPFAGLRDCCVTVSAGQVQRLCAMYGCTVTELVTAAMVCSLQDMHREDPDPARLSVLRVSVPVNLRPFYGSRTLRNFASYVNLGVDVKDGYLPFGELVHRIRVQKREMLRRENLEPKIAANVSLEENVAVRCIPLFIKKPVIDAVNRHHGDRYFSQTLSSLGRVELPESMRPYVVDFDFILGRQRNNAGATTCTTCGDRLHIHFSRSIADDRFERGVVALFHELGFRAEVVHGILA